MRSSRIPPLLLIVPWLIITSAACGPSVTNNPIPQPASSTVEQTILATPIEFKPSPTAQSRSSAVTNLEDVRKSVIQIEAEGTFLDPEIGWDFNAGRQGSGFIIDPSGIAVTNNHVVTGAAILRVWIEGEDSPRNARIIGVSECSDLAVVDVEGNGFAYLEWYADEIKAGLDVFAAGFPSGDADYIVTEGIISQTSASGETNWASMDNVLEHTAKIEPGNSGGPLIDENGRLVGINYSITPQTNQNYAISREEAAQIIEHIRRGEDVDSIGINGVAVSGSVGNTLVQGIWVRSVESGSAADQSGLRPGDIIYQLENELLALDGTMAGYCDVLRSRDAGDTMSLKIIRWEDLSLHEGQLNGRVLEFTGYMDNTVSTNSSDDGPPAGVDDLNPNCTLSDNPGYLECSDDTHTLLAEVPNTWKDINGGQWEYEGEIIGVAISAAPDLEDFNSFYDVPGMFFGVSDTLAVRGEYVYVLDTFTNAYSDCTFNGRYDYTDGLFRGKYDYYYNCGGDGGFDAYVLAAVPVRNEYSYIILMTIQVMKDDKSIVEHIWSTFQVGEL